MLLNINARNHRKTCTIDRKIAFIGSMNISDVHCHHHDHIGWRDTAIRLEGANLKPLSQAFDQAWEQQRFYQSIGDNLKQKPALNPTIRLNHHWRQRRSLYRGLLRQLASAQTRIWITSAYFVPDKLVIKRLVRAAKRGIDVKIVIPKKTDIRYMAWISTSFYPYLLKHGIKIYEYQPTMLHAKTIIVDQWIIAGSSNFNHRSILHDLEVDIKLKQAQAKQALIDQFQQDIALSQQIKSCDLTGTRYFTRLIGWLLSYFKHWV